MSLCENIIITIIIIVVIIIIIIIIIIVIIVVIMPRAGLPVPFLELFVLISRRLRGLCRP